MPTNEERREVARKLRETSDEIRDWCDTNPYWYVMKCIYGDVEIHDDNELFYRLADLIEPEPERTCNVIFRSHEMSQTQTVLVKSCSGCGFEFGTETKNTFPFEVTINSISIPNYCPNCGAKVIQESEKSS